MATDFCDRIFLDIDGTIIPASEISPKGEMADAKIIHLMTRDEWGSGHTAGNFEGSLDITVPRPKDGLVMDFWAMMKERTLFTSTMEFKGGKVLSFLDCIINSIDDGGGSPGANVETKLSCKALRFSYDG